MGGKINVTEDRAVLHVALRAPANATIVGNMVDLDSNPTKLIEIVEIGKQLLITRGALTTFTIANDVAKYFAIVPAMLVGRFPQIAPLNIMFLKSPQSAVGSSFSKIIPRRFRSSIKFHNIV